MSKELEKHYYHSKTKQKCLLTNNVCEGDIDCRQCNVPIVDLLKKNDLDDDDDDDDW